MSKLLASTFPKSYSVYLTNSGTEACEGALKLAKRHTKRYEIISAYQSYHGNTQGSMSVSGAEIQNRAFRPLVPGSKFIKYNSLQDLSKITKNTEEHFLWRKKWDAVLDWDFSKPEISWFKGAKLNITENCIDRHLTTRGNKTAILFEPNHPDEVAEHISYNELYKRVNKFANVLKEQGIKKGDRVCIYVTMIQELAIAVLACARIGAIHSVVFAGFSATALATRIND